MKHFFSQTPAVRKRQAPAFRKPMLSTGTLFPNSFSLRKRFLSARTCFRKHVLSVNTCILKAIAFSKRLLSEGTCFPKPPAFRKHLLAESTGFLKASASRTPLLSATTCIRKYLLAACSCFAKASVLRTLLLFVRPLSKSRKLLPSVKCSCFAQALALRKHLLCASTYCQNAHVFGTPLLCASIRFPQALAFRMEQQLFSASMCLPHVSVFRKYSLPSAPALHKHVLLANTWTCSFKRLAFRKHLLAGSACIL